MTRANLCHMALANTAWRRAIAAVGAIFVLSGVALGGSPAEGDPTASGLCSYYRNTARFDTCWCGLLAEAAALEVRGASTPMMILVDGGATSNERPGIEVKRVELVRNYLVQHIGVDPGRIVLRWKRLDRLGIGRYGGSVRILVIKPGQSIPDFVEGDLAWQAESSRRLAPN